MPNKCCVIGCRGNYKDTKKVHIFKFPRDGNLRQVWIRAISREDLVVSQHTRVCELHFTESDILRETSQLDYVTGSQVTIPLKYLRLRPGAVPSRFPNRTSHLSTDHSPPGEVPGAQRLHLDSRAGETAVAGSTETFVSDREADKILGLKDLADQDHFTADQLEPPILVETGLEKLGSNAVPLTLPHRPLPKERKRLRDGKTESAYGWKKKRLAPGTVLSQSLPVPPLDKTLKLQACWGKSEPRELNGSSELGAMATVTVKTEPQDYIERDERPSSHLVSVKSEPQDYVEWDKEPSSHLVSVKPEPDYYEEYREPNSLVLPLTKDYTDATKVTFHLITEPQASEENWQRDIAAVAVKIELQDPTEVGAEAVFVGTSA